MVVCEDAGGFGTGWLLSLGLVSYRAALECSLGLVVCEDAGGVWTGRLLSLCSLERLASTLECSSLHRTRAPSESEWEWESQGSLMYVTCSTLQSLCYFECLLSRLERRGHTGSIGSV